MEKALRVNGAKTFDMLKDLSSKKRAEITMDMLTFGRVNSLIVSHLLGYRRLDVDKLCKEVYADYLDLKKRKENLTLWGKIKNFITLEYV